MKKEFLIANSDFTKRYWRSNEESANYFAEEMVKQHRELFFVFKKVSSTAVTIKTII